MNKIDIIPTEGHVLVEPYQKPEESGGIILAGDQQNSAPVRGEVLKVAEGKSNFEAGDTIFFRKYAIDELNFINENGIEDKVYLVDVREILGFIPKVQEKDIKKTSETELRKLSKEADKEQRKLAK